MKKFKYFLFIFLFLFFQTHISFSYMSGKVINLNSQSSVIADSNFIGAESINISCRKVFSGSGELTAPVITVLAKEFTFTGTINFLVLQYF